MGVGFYPGMKLYKIGETCCIRRRVPSSLSPRCLCRGSFRYRPDQTPCIFDWTWGSSWFLIKPTGHEYCVPSPTKLLFAEVSSLETSQYHPLSSWKQTNVLRHLRLNHSVISDMIFLFEAWILFGLRDVVPWFRSLPLSSFLSLFLIYLPHQRRPKAHFFGDWPCFYGCFFWQWGPHRWLLLAPMRHWGHASRMPWRVLPWPVICSMTALWIATIWTSPLLQQQWPSPRECLYREWFIMSLAHRPQFFTAGGCYCPVCRRERISSPGQKWRAQLRQLRWDFEITLA